MAAAQEFPVAYPTSLVSLLASVLILSSIPWPATVGAVAPSGVYRATVTSAVGGIVGYLVLLDFGTTVMAKLHPVILRPQVR